MSNVTEPKTLTQLNAELLANIAETIVEPEVMKPMQAVGWSHADPTTVPPVQDNPETAQKPAEEAPKPDAQKVDNPPTVTADATPSAPAATSTIDWESLRGKNGLILDKYTSESEAVKGIGHAVAMAKQAFARANEVERENAELRSKLVAPAPIVTQQITQAEPLPPADYVSLDDVLNEIIEEGGTLDEKNATKLREAIVTQSRTTAQKAVEEALTAKDAKAAKENQKWIEVDAYMRHKHPASVNFTDEMALFVESDPLTKTTVSALISTGNEKQAAELAWERFQASQNMKIDAENQRKEITLEAADQVRREAVDEARKNAGVIPSMASGVHETPNVGPSQEEIDAAGAEMARTGLGARWRALTIGKDLTGPLFD